MAAEATRSNSSVDSYVGSLISLTSKSEIRYEGILFNINTDEASIGLRNVRSFGTEGRKKDGPQIPPIDKVYEYIVFRGSDIKDLQVKSSPPVQTPPYVHNDPAIIQSHYSPSPSTSTGVPSAKNGSLLDPSIQMPYSGQTRPTFPGSIPLYQPGGSLGSWSSSASPLTSVSGLGMPMYYQGLFGPSSGGNQTQQQPLLQPGQGMGNQPSIQQSVQYSSTSASLPTGAANLPASLSSEFPPPLLPPIGSSSLNMQSTLLPLQPSGASMSSMSSMSMMSAKPPGQVLPAVSQITTLPLASLPPSTLPDKAAVGSSFSNQTNLVSGPVMPYNNASEALPRLVGSSTSPPLVTPGQFLQPGPNRLSPSQPSHLAQRDVEVVQVSSSLSLETVPSAAVTSAAAPAQAPLLPLPSPSNLKVNGGYMHTRHINRGGYRGRGNELSRAATKFTEEFDFEAMNEKFKKDEVWGHLGKSKAQGDDMRDPQVEDDAECSNVEFKPVYKKDDFFDTLSCNSLDNTSRNGRPRFSEQMRVDSETFGEFSRYRGRGGRGPGRGGRSRGGYYGRGYGYIGRGRGHNVYRAT